MRSASYLQEHNNDMLSGEEATHGAKRAHSMFWGGTNPERFMAVYRPDLCLPSHRDQTSAALQMRSSRVVLDTHPNTIETSPVSKRFSVYA